MATSAPAQRMGAGVMLFLVLLIPAAAAQVPSVPSNPQSSVIAFSVECPQQFLMPVRGAYSETTCIVRDLTRDSPAQPGNTPIAQTVPHFVRLSVTNLSVPPTTGWLAQIGRPDIPITGGGVETVTIRVFATPVVSTLNFKFDVVANYTGPGDQTSQATLPFAAQVKRFDFVDIQIGGGRSVQNVEQNELVTFPLQITNGGVYPDIYYVTATSSIPDVKVSNPGTVYVPAHESRIVNVSALTPHGKFYDLGTNAQIQIRVTSATGSFTDTRTGIVNISGFYVAGYWIPVTFLAFLSVLIVTRRAREALLIRRLEQERPRPAEPSPKQAVLLEELKRQDRPRWRERLATYDALYKEKRRGWIAVFRERRAKDRAEARDAHREFKAARREQKKARAARLRAVKEEKLAARDARNEERKKEKLLDAKRRKLQKKKAKLDAKQSARDLKQAKIDAKVAAKAIQTKAKATKAKEKAEKKAKKRGGA